MSAAVKIEWVVLDAMGVLYSVGRDVEELLIPFLREHGCDAPEDHIRRDYKTCSLGHMDTDDFWEACGLDAHDGFDCDYTFLHKLSAGLVPTLNALKSKGIRIACLSNDTREWSRMLRRRFRLDRWIDTWIVSAEVGLRKPDTALYERLLKELGARPENCLYVDDREANLIPADKLGMRTMHFRREDGGSVSQFNGLLYTVENPN